VIGEPRGQRVIADPLPFRSARGGRIESALPVGSWASGQPWSNAADEMGEPATADLDPRDHGDRYLLARRGIFHSRIR
jgi:hypothetical protein